MHFRTTFLTQMEIWRAIPFNPLTFMSLPVVSRGNFHTADVFSASEKNFFICSESHCMLSVAPWLHNSPSVTCLEFINWQTFVGTNLNFPMYLSRFWLFAETIASKSIQGFTQMLMVCTTCRSTHLHLRPLAEWRTSCVGGGIPGSQQLKREIRKFNQKGFFSSLKNMSQLPGKSGFECLLLTWYNERERPQLFIFKQK